MPMNEITIGDVMKQDIVIICEKCGNNIIATKDYNDKQLSQHYVNLKLNRSDKKYLNNIYMQMGLSKKDIKERCDPVFLIDVQCPKCGKVVKV
jgi:predicted RNA-binding Zn-ribbon protein involved in translation (DUF1610 family)